MINNIIQKIKYNKLVVRIYTSLILRVRRNMIVTDVPEVRPIQVRKTSEKNDHLRLNIVVPSVQLRDVFGGISTALSFFQNLTDKLKCDSRIIVIDREIEKRDMISLEGYQIIDWKEESDATKQLVDFTIRQRKTLVVRESDVFIATSWWSAYILEPIIGWQNKNYNNQNRSLFYFIQDYEPGFYPWSSKYVMAESTYKMEIPTIGIFNSKLLYEFFLEKGYCFKKAWYFDPVLNEDLKCFLDRADLSVPRKKQIIIYGRPNTSRNAFELIMESLRIWGEKEKNAKDWEIYSLGEKFPDIKIGNGVVIKSLGKLTLEEYAKIMLETKVGISLMISPHPSYPPLEMSTFGIQTITNCFENKNLNDYKNIICLENCSSNSLADMIYKVCHEKIKGTGEKDIFKCNSSFSDVIEASYNEILLEYGNQ